MGVGRERVDDGGLRIGRHQPTNGAINVEMDSAEPIPGVTGNAVEVDQGLMQLPFRRRLSEVRSLQRLQGRAQTLTLLSG